MAVHDAYARLTPYELLLPDPEFADRRFPAIAEEAAERGADPGNPAAFVMLGAVQGILAELREDDAPRESAHDHAGLLHFAYQMWRCGGCAAAEPRPGGHVDAGEPPTGGHDPAVVLVTAASVRELLRGSSTNGSDPASPESDPASAADERASALRDRAGYVQLPQHLVWLEEGPESVDGLFWHADRRDTLHLALVAGMRSDRAGCVFVPVPPQPLASLGEWARGPAREGGGDFSTSMPGADLDGLAGIRTPAEVYKLAALVLGRLAAGGSPASSGHVSEAGSGPRPTALPWARLA